MINPRERKHIGIYALSSQAHFSSSDQIDSKLHIFLLRCWSFNLPWNCGGLPSIKVFLFTWISVGIGCHILAMLFIYWINPIRWSLTHKGNHKISNKGFVSICMCIANGMRYVALNGVEKFCVLCDLCRHRHVNLIRKFSI